MAGVAPELPPASLTPRHDAIDEQSRPMVGHHRRGNHSEVEFWLQESKPKKPTIEVENFVTDDRTSEGSFCLGKDNGSEIHSPGSMSPFLRSTDEPNVAESYSSEGQYVDPKASAETVDTLEQAEKGMGVGKAKVNGLSTPVPISATIGEDILDMDPPTRMSPRFRSSSDSKVQPPKRADEVLAEQIVQEALEKQSSSSFAGRFSLADIANNPDLAKAAKMELGGLSLEADSVSVVESACDGESRITELEKVRFTADSADRDAEREGQAGVEEVDVLVKRLEVGRKSVSNMLKMVMKLHQAEVAYSRSLVAVARVSVSNLGHSEGMKVAAEGIAELPMVVGGAHSQVCLSLSDCETKLKAVMNRIKVVSDELLAKSAVIHTTLTAKRSALMKAIGSHEAACKSSDIETAPAPALKGTDPWLTEGKLANGHTDLLGAQYTLRSFLGSAFSHVRDVETFRLQTAKQVMSSLMKAYGNVVEQALLPYVNDMMKVVNVVDVDQEVVDLNESAVTNASAAAAVSAQGTEETGLRCGELFSSPDIIRQGELQVRDAEMSDWKTGHFVLTQAGFLYWFLGQKIGPLPDDSINLSRCAFGQGEAPEFKIVEGGMGLFGWRRTISFLAPSVEESCEWAISVRETIAQVRASRRRKGKQQRHKRTYA